MNQDKNDRNSFLSFIEQDREWTGFDNKLRAVERFTAIAGSEIVHDRASLSDL